MIAIEGLLLDVSLSGNLLSHSHLPFSSISLPLSQSLSLSHLYSELFTLLNVSINPHSNILSHTLSLCITLFLSFWLDSISLSVINFIYFSLSFSSLCVFLCLSLSLFLCLCLSLCLSLSLSLCCTLSLGNNAALSHSNKHTQAISFFIVMSPFSSLYQQQRPNCFSPTFCCCRRPGFCIWVKKNIQPRMPLMSWF